MSNVRFRSPACKAGALQPRAEPKAPPWVMSCKGQGNSGFASPLQGEIGVCVPYPRAALRFALGCYAPPFQGEFRKHNRSRRLQKEFVL